MDQGYPQVRAFPFDAQHQGMDLLEYFTAAALQGLLAGKEFPQDPTKASAWIENTAKDALAAALATLRALHRHKNA